VTSLRINQRRIASLVEQLYDINKRLVGYEGRLMRLAESHGVPREDFLRNYPGSELDPRWLNRVSKLAAKGWKNFVAKEKDTIGQYRHYIQDLVGQTGLEIGEFRKIMQMVEKGEREARQAKKTSKLDIAGDHIRAAIQMIAMGVNGYSTHVIVMACEEMLRSIAEAKKVKLSGSFDDAIKPDRLNEWRQHLRSAYNFFKHADKDPAEGYEGPSGDKLNTVNEILTMLNCSSYMELSGTAPDEMTLFMHLTASRHHANVLDDKFFEKFPEAEATAKKLVQTDPDKVRWGLRFILHKQGLLPDPPA